jgi:hypothetical protein
MLKLIRLFSGQSEEVNHGEYRCFFNTSMLTNVRSLSLKTCCFQNNHPNIFASDENPNDTRNNNIFSYEIGGVSGSVVVSQTGYYTATELISLINAVITPAYAAANVGGTAVLGIDLISNKLKITITGPIANELYILGADTSHSLNKTLGNFINLGFPATSNFDSFANLTGLKYATVSIRSKSPQTILNATALKERHVNSIGAIPVDIIYGRLQTYTNPSPADTTLTFSYPEDFREMIFILRDEFGRRIKNQTLSFGVEFVVMSHT